MNLNLNINLHKKMKKLINKFYTFLMSGKNKRIRKISLIKNDVEIIEQRAKEISSKQFDEDYERRKRINGTCSCGSHNIVKQFKEIKGRINGSFGGSFLGVGGYVSGGIDTYTVNHCNDCGNEWKEYEYQYLSIDDIIKSKIYDIIYLLDEYKRCKDVKFNPLDINDKYKSLEEKKEAVYKEYNEYLNSPYRKESYEFWEDINIITLEYLINNRYKGSSRTLSKDEKNVLKSIGLIDKKI